MLCAVQSFWDYVLVGGNFLLCWCKYYLLVPPRLAKFKRGEGECCVVLRPCGKVNKERKKGEAEERRR